MAWESFSCAWRIYQSTSRNLGAKTNEGFGLFEKGDHLQLQPCIVDASHILKTELQILFGVFNWADSAQSQGHDWPFGLNASAGTTNRPPPKEPTPGFLPVHGLLARVGYQSP